MRRQFNMLMKRPIASLLDMCMVPLALIGAAAASLTLRNLNHSPVCRRVFDAFGIYPIRHNYHTPLVYPSDLKMPLYCDRIIEGLNINAGVQLELVSNFHYRDELLAIPIHSAGLRTFGYNNGMFEAGDAEYLYNMIRYFKPSRIIEIGCGQSTMMAQLAIQANKADDAHYNCRQICIEPFEAPWLDEIGVELYRSKVEDLSPTFFDMLDINDILFIDSSHIIRPQGDVLFEYLTIIGRLRAGVLIHVHDIFTPRDYPERWTISDRRMWNEQYLLEAFLCFNSEFRIIAALNWLWHNHKEKMHEACPVLMSQPTREPGSFWIKRGGA